MIKLLVLLLASCFSGVLYRMGGSGRYPRQVRVIGCPLISMGLLLTNIHPVNILGWLMFILSLGLSIGAISTYWDFLFNDEDNFFMHGFILGFALLPCMPFLHWYSILFRAAILAIGMGFWSKWISKDVIEERGRGFILTATIPLLLI